MMAFSTVAFRRTLTTSVVTVAVAFAPILTAIAQAVTLNGAGATFPAPLYERYIAEFQKKILISRSTIKRSAAVAALSKSSRV